MRKKLKNLIHLSKLKISEVKRKNFIIRLFSLILVIIFSKLLLFLLQGIYKEYFEILINFIIFLLTLNLFLILLRHISVSAYRKKNKLNENYFDNYILGIGAIAVILNFIIGIGAIFYFFNIDFKLFITSFALFFAGLAWVFKDHINNLVNGFILIFTDDIRLADYLGFEEFKGRVKNISFLNTELKTDEGNIVYIPNSVILTNEVINYSREKYKRIILEFDIDKENFGKIEKLENFLFKKLKERFQDLVIDEFLYLRINKIDVDRVNVNFEISVKKYNFEIEEEIKKYTSICILDFIDKKFE